MTGFEALVLTNASVDKGVALTLDLDVGAVKAAIDGYTTTAHYPNAQRAITSDLPANSGLNRRMNYVRNSVKAVVDAYDGTVKLYVVDSADPLIRAYQKAFPKLFTPKSKIPTTSPSTSGIPKISSRSRPGCTGATT